MAEGADHVDDRRASRSRWVFVAFAVIAAYFLVAEHGAHVVPYLPWLLLLACPLMHVFLHGRHGGHGRHFDHGRDRAAPDADPRRPGSPVDERAAP